MDRVLRKELRQAEKEKKRCKKQYPDWEDNEYNCGPLKYVWGVQSNSQDATNFYQLTDLDIYYNRDTTKYILGLETLYVFETNQARLDYLDNLLFRFYNYLRDQFDSTVDPFHLYQYNNGNLFEADSLTELYYKFKIFVKGYQLL